MRRHLVPALSIVALIATIYLAGMALLFLLVDLNSMSSDEEG